MIFFRLFVFFFLLTAARPATGTEASPIRVAVVAEGNADVEALLLAKLGKQAGLVLLSRSDLPVLEREAESLAQTGDIRLEGADRLVLIRKAGDSLAVRVADCASGVIVHESSLPPNLDAAETAELLALRLPRYLRIVPNGKTRRFSLVGFRFPTFTEENRAIEARVNLSCAVALQVSESAVVVERWRMKDVVFEKSLRPEAIGAFWNSAALVEGGLFRDGEKLIVKMEVKSPSGESRQLMTVEGSASNLPELGRRLAAALLKVSSLPEETLQDEAKSCLSEARWLIDHGLPSEAVQAAEAAAALDPASRDAEILRIRAYASGAYNDDLSIKGYHGSPGYSEAISATKIEYSVAMATEMSRLLEDYIVKYPPQNTESYEDPVCLGVRAVHTCLSVLNAAHDHDYYVRNPAAVESLRASTQRNAALLRERARAMYLSNLDVYLSVYAAYRCATPEETISEYRAALGRDFPAAFRKSWPVAVRYNMVPTLGHNPPLFDVDPADRSAARPARVFCRVVSWKPGGDAHARDVWKAYVDELAASNDLLKKADGLYFRWGAQKSDASREKALGDILDFLENNPDVLTGPDGRAIAQMVAKPMESLSYVSDGKLCTRYVDVLTKLFGREIVLPYELVQSLPQAFGYRRNDASIKDDMVRLQKAMTANLGYHRQATKPDDYYLGVLRGALGSLRGQYPPPPSEEDLKGALVISRFWFKSEYIARGNLDRSSGTWREGKLWFTQQDPVGFWKIDPQTFQSEFYAGPDGPQRLVSLNGNSRPLFRSGRIFVSGGKDLWSFNLEKKEWHAFGLPRAGYLLFEANEALWAVHGHGPFGQYNQAEDQGTALYRIDTGKDTADLIFSTRRRPAEHPLDSMEIAAPMGCFSGNGGFPVVGFVGKSKAFLQTKDGSAWNDVPADRAWDRICLGEGALITSRVNCGSGMRRPPLLEGVVFVDTKGKSEVLLIDQRVQKASGLPPMPGSPVWEIPEDLNAYSEIGNRYYCPAVSGNRLFVMVADVQGSTEKYTTSSALYVFERGIRSPVRIPLRFELPEQARKVFEAKHKDPRRDTNPWPNWYSFLADSKGLVIASYSGFWFVPMSEVDQMIEKARKDLARNP